MADPQRPGINQSQRCSICARSWSRLLQQAFRCDSASGAGRALQWVLPFTQFYVAGSDPILVAFAPIYRKLAAVETENISLESEGQLVVIGVGGTKRISQLHLSAEQYCHGAL